MLALFAIAGSIFGIWLGNQLQNRREDRRWRKDKRLEAYVAYVVAMARYEAALLMVPIFEAHSGKVPRDHAVKYADAITTYAGARATARLVASKALDEVILKADKRLAEYPGAQPPRLEEDLKFTLGPDMQPEDAEFLKAARDDLGIPSK